MYTDDCILNCLLTFNTCIMYIAIFWSAPNFTNYINFEPLVSHFKSASVVIWMPYGISILAILATVIFHLTIHFVCVVILVSVLVQYSSRMMVNLAGNLTLASYSLYIKLLHRPSQIHEHRNRWHVVYCDHIDLDVPITFAGESILT